LRIERRTRSVLGSGKGTVRPITRHLDDVPVVRGDRVAQDLVVASERGLHRLRVFLPQTRRPLEVGEQEGDRPGRQLSWHR